MSISIRKRRGPAPAPASVSESATASARTLVAFPKSAMSEAYLWVCCPALTSGQTYLCVAIFVGTAPVTTSGCTLVQDDLFFDLD